jgi:hypothetical protein
LLIPAQYCNNGLKERANKGLVLFPTFALARLYSTGPGTDWMAYEELVHHKKLSIIEYKKIMTIELFL